MNNGEKHLVSQARRVGLKITKDLQTGKYHLVWSNGIMRADDVGILEADDIVTSCAAALKHKEQRFRDRAAALGLRLTKHAVSGTDQKMYFLKATETTCYGAETLEELAAVFFHLSEA